MEFGRYLRAMADLILPRGCIVCGRRLNLSEKHICMNCLADMPQTRFWERSHNPMADKFNERIQKRIQNQTDPTCEEPYNFAASLFFYHSDAGYRKIPYQLKYSGNCASGEYFGRILGGKLSGEIWKDIDTIIPVPLHWTRRWKRGYNQAEIIAKAVAEEISAEIRTDILIRRRRTVTQTELDIPEKEKNVDGAFHARAETIADPASGPSSPTIRHILLIDDVFTTGNTLAACHQALRKVFPPTVRISIATLGYLER